LTNPYVVTQSDTMAHNWSEGSTELTDVKNLYTDIANDDVLGAVFDTGGAALDVLGDIGDPLGAVISCAVGWIVDHVSFLRDPVDWLAGDPHSIEASVKTYANVGAGMHKAARHYADALTALDADAWSGTAADAYRRQGADWVDALDGAGSAAELEGVLISATGGLCAGVRAELFDLVSAAIERWVMVGLVALANSAWTFGASIASWVIDVEIEAGLLAARIAAKIANLIGKAGRIAQRLGTDGGKLEAIGQRLVALSDRMMHNVHSTRGFLSWDRQHSNAPRTTLTDMQSDARHLQLSLQTGHDIIHPKLVGAGLTGIKDAGEIALDPGAQTLDTAAADATKTGSKNAMHAARDAATGP
jgi:hypothetical protein